MKPRTDTTTTRTTTLQGKWIQGFLTASPEERERLKKEAPGLSDHDALFRYAELGDGKNWLPCEKQDLHLAPWEPWPAKSADANPADTEAAAGLAMAKVLQRTQGVDLNAAREAAAANPDDVDAQTLVADLDLLGGHVEDAFNRLVDVVRRTSDADRNKAREHLLGLFAAVGNDDPRVTRARQNLASALF